MCCAETLASGSGTVSDEERAALILESMPVDDIDRIVLKVAARVPLHECRGHILHCISAAFQRYCDYEFSCNIMVTVLRYFSFMSSAAHLLWKWDYRI